MKRVELPTLERRDCEIIISEIEKKRTGSNEVC